MKNLENVGEHWVIEVRCEYWYVDLNSSLDIHNVFVLCKYIAWCDNEIFVGYASSSRKKWLRELKELKKANEELVMKIENHKSLKELQEEEKELLHEVNFLMGLQD